MNDWLAAAFGLIIAFAGILHLRALSHMTID